eukprot:CAMPEP_0182427472 /NCGR_PEP_ID=MMETSP1167-20130531/17394_1 /TAXON_ID=2988 /ORGANISM="Mallomonas Sp, Strain CCMP3275" /LENGTH=79 /DNA_ID=CAMNT_0024609731 /DNA_START=584 /DNA_END=823 /DNA_ORIENTATION=-
MPEYGKKIEDYLTAKGETVQKMSVSARELENNYLVDSDGSLSLFPKEGGQPPLDVNIIDLPPPPPSSSSSSSGKGFGKT